MIELYILGGIGALFGIVGLRAAAKVIWRRVLRPKVKGHRGESKVNKILRRLSRRGGHLKEDILIPSLRGTTQIDHVLVTKHGIFVIETKNYSGVIDGNANDRLWRQYMPNGHSSSRSFLNPLMQNEGHIAALKSILKDFDNVPMYSLVAFNPKAVYPDLPGVVGFHNLKQTIRLISSGPPVLSDKQVEDLAKTIEGYEIHGKKERSMHNFRAGLGASKAETEAFIADAARNSKRLTFPAPAGYTPESEETRKRHMLTDIYAKLTIRGQTDTIEGFYEKSKRLEDGSAVSPDGHYDYFICPFTGDRFPPSESNNLYKGLWLSYLNKHPDLVSFMKDFGVANLGNSYKCKKVLSLYDADRDALIGETKQSVWYQNMLQKQKLSGLSNRIQSAESRQQGNPHPEKTMYMER